MSRASSNDPALAAVTRLVTGATIEDALYKFEESCSEENFQSLKIQEQAQRRDGVLVRYSVSWKYTVLEDTPSGSHVSWALLVADASGFRVAAATREHIMPGALEL